MPLKWWNIHYSYAPQRSEQDPGKSGGWLDSVYISTFQVWIYTFVHIHIFSARLCIYTPYTNFWKWPLETCFFSYSLFSAPQAPPNAILRSLFPFPLRSERSGIVLGWFCESIPSIHIWICEYTHLCIYTFYCPICAYYTHVHIHNIYTLTWTLKLSK